MVRCEWSGQRTKDGLGEADLEEQKQQTRSQRIVEELPITREVLHFDLRRLEGVDFLVDLAEALPVGRAEVPATGGLCHLLERGLVDVDFLIAVEGVAP